MSAQLTCEGTQAATTHPADPAGHGQLGRAWHRIRLAVAEMNYAAQRIVQIQAPWAVDDQWHTK
jgi:hypothetical protein